MRPGQNSFGEQSCLRSQPDGVLLAVKLQPRASANEIGAPLAGELKIKVTAPPVDAAANEALIHFLAKTLELARNRVELVQGHKSRHKLVKLHGLSLPEAHAKLNLPPTRGQENLK